MIERGLVTVYVADMDRSVRFFSEVLGMKVEQRFGNHWASVSAPGLTIGLHPATERHPAGSTMIGLQLSKPIRDVVPELEDKVRFEGPIEEDNAGWLSYFQDPDGNRMYMTELKWKR